MVVSFRNMIDAVLRDYEEPFQEPSSIAIAERGPEAKRDRIQKAREWLADEGARKEAAGRLGIPKEFARAYVPDIVGEVPSLNEKGLFISGPIGVGKTWLGSAILLWESAVWSNAKPLSKACRWSMVSDVLIDLRATMGARGDEGAESERGVISRYSAYDLLLLDDLGSEYQTDWTWDSLYSILCRRIDAGKPTIVTSNYTLTEINDTHPRIASRLGAMAFHKMQGDDRRLQES